MIRAVADDSETSLLSTELNQRLETVLPLRGMVCRSVMKLDVQEIHFEDCVPGGNYVKDFTIWNRSEISLLFRLVSLADVFENTRDILECTVYDTGARLASRSCHVPAYGHMKIRVAFRPKMVRYWFSYVVKVCAI